MKPNLLSHAAKVGAIGILGLSLATTGCQTTSGGSSGGGKRGASVGRVQVIPKNEMELKILRQAVTVGTVAGGTAGYFIAQNNNINPYAGAAAGALVGALAGSGVAKAQIKDVRFKQLDVNKKAQLVQSAQTYNQNMANRIRVMRAQVAALDPEFSSKQAVIQSIQQSYDNVSNQIASSDTLMEGASGVQASQYREELDSLRSKRTELEALLKQANAKIAPTRA